MKIMYVFLLSVVVQSVFAMENKILNTKILKEDIVSVIPGVKKPREIACLAHGIIAVVSGRLNHQKDTFVLYDSINQKTIMSRSSGQPIYSFAVDASKTKVVLCEKEELTVFNAMTGENEWSEVRKTNNNAVVIFNPINNNQIVFVIGHMTIYDIVEKTKNVREANYGIRPNSKRVHDPVKTVLFVNSGVNGYIINDYIAGKRIKESGQKIFESDFLIKGNVYNKDGSRIAIMGQGVGTPRIALVHTDSDDIKYIQGHVPYDAMLFHPNNKILFLLRFNNVLECWDIERNKCIHNIYFEQQEDISHSDNLYKRLAVSPSGQELFIALDNVCTKISIDSLF